MKLRLLLVAATVPLFCAGMSVGQTGFTGHGPATPCLTKGNGGLSNPGAAAQCAGPVNNRTITLINAVQLIHARFAIATAGGSTISQQLTAGSQVSIPIRADATGTIEIDTLDITGWHTMCTTKIEDHGTGNISVAVTGSAYAGSCTYAP